MNYEYKLFYKRDPLRVKFHIREYRIHECPKSNASARALRPAEEESRKAQRTSKTAERSSEGAEVAQEKLELLEPRARA